MRRPGLDAAVLICGACTMVLELVGSRLLAPYFGTSVFVWTALIGVVLAALSAGYWAGGRLADRCPDPRLLAGAIFLTGIYCAGLALLSDVLLTFVQHQFADLRLGSVISAGLLFGPPSVCLGLVVPYAVRLRLDAVEHGGATAGRLYALSTWGSIAGTFLTGFVLLAHFGHTVILWCVAAALGAASLLVWSAGGRAARIVLVAFALGGAGASEALGAVWRGPAFFDVDTAYNRIWIYDAFGGQGADPVRVMQINDEMSSKMFTARGGLADGYTPYYHLARHFKPDTGRVLMIGGAGYSYPKDFLRTRSGGRIDVVEIDPGVTALARRHFALADDPRLGIFHEDARTFLNRGHAERYDAILGDAFMSYSIPFQLVTVEAARRMHALLADDGVLIVNVIGSLEGPAGRLPRAFIATLKTVFPQVHVFAVRDPDDGALVQNLILVALKSSERPLFYSRDTELDRYLHHVWIREIPADVPVLTDDRAPVEELLSPVVSVLRRGSSNPWIRRWKNLVSAGRKKRAA